VHSLVKKILGEEETRPKKRGDFEKSCSFEKNEKKIYIRGSFWGIGLLLKKVKKLGEGGKT